MYQPLNTLVTIVENPVVSTEQVNDTIVSLELSDTLITNEIKSDVVSVTESMSIVNTETAISVILASGAQGPEGKPGLSEDDIVYAKRVDMISDLLLYRGEAAVGSSESSPVWRIRKISLGTDGDVSETWANGSATFTNIWANRAGLTYS